MISIQGALEQYEEQVSPVDREVIAVHAALHQVLAAEVLSQADLPRFDQSAMDGYAFRASDTADAPTELTICGVSAAGSWPTEALKAGQAWRIYTGAPLPADADTVIAQERVQRLDERLIIEAAYPAGKNIRYQGEEIARGTAVAAPGQRLSPGLIASLCNAGITTVEVFRRPRISLLVTGDEVRSPGSDLGPAEIPDSNGPYIRNWLLANGYPAPEVIYVSDRKRSVLESIEAAARHCDLLITTGGASVGDRDFIPASAQELGFQQIFWKVAQKPGKPLFFGMRGQQAFLGLPGNPGAVLVGMEIHARCILNHMQGLRQASLPWRSALLQTSVDADAQRDRLVRMQLIQNSHGHVQLRPLGRQDSHMLSNLAQAEVLAHVPAAQQAHAAGQPLRYLCLTS